MEPFKNNLSPQLVNCIAGHLEKHVSNFERTTFENAILQDLESLELKERAQLIATHIHHILPCEHQSRFNIIRAILRPIDKDQIGVQSDERGISGWGMFPLGMVVGQHSLAAFDEALDLLKDMTTRFSSEFDVRYFILADQPRALNIMKGWVKDTNHHVRRLVSEGSRPRLPWAMHLPQLIADPSPTLPLLEALRDDEEEYVRRSVANHLNDIAKDHPDLVAELAGEWMKGASVQRKKLLRHACRTLIKQGHPIALNAFGFEPPLIDLTQLSIKTKVVMLGGDLVFTVGLHSTCAMPQPLIIDYILHFKKANGKQAGKVFKWKVITLSAYAAMTLEKKHSLNIITTRRYYTGQQSLSLRINGQDFGAEEFMLKVPQ